MDNEINKCEELGYVMTLLGRRRYIPEIKSPNIGLRQFAQRQAMNTPVQGSAADLLKLAMINIQKKLEEQKLSSQMIITVHDELVFDAVIKEEKELFDLIRLEMEQALTLSVPIKVSIKTGPNWLNMKEVK
jgi:DNA polymerase-1